MKTTSARGRKSRRFLPWWMVAAFGACILLSTPPARAQLGDHAKVPGVSKNTTTGPTRQAFTGLIQNLDWKEHVLNVAVGENTAIFPIKKKMKISTIGGARLSLAALSPGTNVIVYYEQRGGHRTVDQIIVLAAPAASNSKKAHPTS